MIITTATEVMFSGTVVVCVCVCVCVSVCHQDRGKLLARCSCNMAEVCGRDHGRTKYILASNHGGNHPNFPLPVTLGDRVFGLDGIYAIHLKVQ